ncbi:MAG: helix-hairpin-helix domain-containing protein [Thermoguttaceae bacterium]
MTLEAVTVNLRSLARDIGLNAEQVAATVTLLDDGHPIPFIARYRKDVTGNLHEDEIRLVARELLAARTLADRKTTILRSIEMLGKLDADLDKKIREARSAKRLEDIYLPFKPKRQTLAAAARSRGLEPLATEILNATITEDKLNERAGEFVDPDKGVTSIADALLGAGQIISEWFSEKVEVRHRLRDLVQRTGRLVSKRSPSFVIDESVAPATPVPESPTEKSDAATCVASPPDQNGSVRSENPFPARGTISVEQQSQHEPTLPVGHQQSPCEDCECPNGQTDVGGGFVSTDMDALRAKENHTPNATTPTESPASPPDDAAAIGEQFQQWRAAQLEKGIPVVKSQNQQRKKKKLALKKRKAEAVLRKMRHQERVFRDYFKFSAPIRKVPPYRVLAVNRGEKAEVLKVGIEMDSKAVTEIVESLCVPAGHSHTVFLKGCARDAIQRLLLPAMENDVRKSLTEHAETHSLQVFANNLRALLKQSPLDRRRVLALDPGFKSGVKAVALDEFGNVLGNATLFPIGAKERRDAATTALVKMIRDFKSSVIAIGNGTGCRETEAWVAQTISEHLAAEEVSYVIVSEAGASVYSASPIAKQEFPDLDILVRGAISIGRRLQDPLNELVKIDPQNLGVGMYQHDVKPKALKGALAEVVESCVNYVGVDLNTASVEILRYVAGLNQLTARRIYDYRQQHGPYKTRDELKKVPGLGPVTFAYAAGFLRIPRGINPLDATWIHPESYDLATRILAKIGFTPADLLLGETQEKIRKQIESLDVNALVAELVPPSLLPNETLPQTADASEVNADKKTVKEPEPSIGAYTIRSILAQFIRPGRDPRQSIKPLFRRGVLKIDDLAPEMELQGTVLNVVDFGAFVDIGLHESGLVHISQMADKFVSSAHDLISVGDVVRVWVHGVDKERGRVSLSMLPPGTPPAQRAERPQGERQRSERPRRERPQRDAAATPKEPRTDKPRQDSPRGERPQGEHKRSDAPRGERPQSERPRSDAPRGERPQGERPRSDAPRGERPRSDRPRDGGRRDGRRDDRRDDRRERTPKTYVVESARNETKPITEAMRTGKEALRSFGDLAQLFGRVSVTNESEKKTAKPKSEPQREPKKPADTDSPAATS